MSCCIGRRCGSDLAWLWLWHKLAAVALKRQKTKKKKKNRKRYGILLGFENKSLSSLLLWILTEEMVILYCYFTTVNINGV